MLELGSAAEKEHKNLGKSLRRYQVNCLFTYGHLAKQINEAANVSVKNHFEDKNDLARQLAAFVAAGDLVLVKGSRGMKMEDVVSVLQQKFVQG
jgi:UDP-N-acetylmuramoyl-tripeptide--D-alanyl-D-alanine ligase